MLGSIKSPVALFISLMAVMVLAVTAGCGETEEAAPETQQSEPAMEESQAEKAAETEEGIDAVMATLTIVPEGKLGTGETKQMDVKYLPPGKKMATLETTKGDIKIELWEEETPNTVINFVHLANSGRYDDVEFHRVIDGFMAQTGDVEKRGGYGGPGYTIPAEFDADLKHVRGVVSMARSNHEDSAGSQFFIMFAPASHLDGKYTAFGKVIEGMDVVDALSKGEPPQNPDKILKARVESIPEE